VDSDNAGAVLAKLSKAIEENAVPPCVNLKFLEYIVLKLLLSSLITVGVAFSIFAAVGIAGVELNKLGAIYAIC
jgi:multidrug transporter EmrE-like cation transporter